MIADRKLPKLKKGWPMWSTVIQMLALLSATLIMLVHIAIYGDSDSINVNRIVSALLLISFLLVMSYIVFGPSVVSKEEGSLDSSNEE